MKLCERIDFVVRSLPNHSRRSPISTTEKNKAHRIQGMSRVLE